jgi:hypothetical protein
MLVLSTKVSGTASVFWLAVGTSLLATGAYSVLQVLLTTRQFDSFLRASIDQSIEENVGAGIATLLEIVQASDDRTNGQIGALVLP